MTLKELECPNCGHIIMKEVGEAINLSEDPKRIKEIIQGKFNTTICSKCKTKIEHKSHVLLTYLNPPRWVWLVSKKHKSPKYKEEFFSQIIPPGSAQFIHQEMVFVEFGEPCESLRFILEKEQPQSSKDWLELGKIHTGEEAIYCYQNALRINKKLNEAKDLLDIEMEKLKSYSN